MSKYLFYTENHAFGGGGKYMVDLVNALESNSHKIAVYSNDKTLGITPSQSINASIIMNPIRIFTLYFLAQLNLKNLFLSRTAYACHLFLEPFVTLLNTLFFIVHILKEQPDKVIICNGGFPAALSCLSMAFAARLCGVVAVMSIVSMPIARRKYLRAYDAFLDRCVWRSLSLIIVNCEAIKKDLVSLRNANPDKIEVIYNASTPPSQPIESIFRSSLITIGCISRMEYSKGVGVLLEAFNLLQKRHTNIRLLLVGEGTALQDLIGKVERYGLEEKVLIQGFQKGNIFDLMCQIDIFAHPSFWEGFPYSIIEAASCGRAIIATDVGGVGEIIENNRTGLLIPPRSIESLVEHIDFLLGNLEHAKRLGEGAKKSYETFFTLDKMHARVREVLT